MTSRQGAGAPLPERGGPGPRAASIAPPIHAPVIGEYPVLRAIRSNLLLDLIRHSDFPLQIRRTARLVGDLAAITSTLTMTFANLLFHSMSGDSPQRLQQHFHLSLQAVDIINNLCTQPLVLRDWHFSEEHCHLTIRLLGAFTGFGGAQICAPEPDNFAQVVAAPALPHDEALFLNSIFFLMLSRDLTPLALAQSLARARFWHWSDDRRTFFTLDYHVGQGLLIRWAIRTKEAQDLGVSVGDFQGLSNNLVQICTGMAKGALQTRTALHGRAIHNRFRPNGAMARRRRQGPTRKNLQDGAGQRRFATR